MRLRVLPVLVVMCVLVAVASAQCSSGEIVSNPNRPTFTNNTSTTQCGVLESDYGFTYVTLPEHVSQRLMTGSLRLGFTDRIDLRWATDTFNYLGTAASSVSGVGDNYATVRYRFLEQKGKRPAMAATYGVKLPTADSRRSLGTGKVDHSVALIASKDIGNNHLDLNAIAVSVGVAGAPCDKAAAWSGALTHPLTSRLALTGEFYSYTSLNASETATAATLWSLSYKFSPRLYIDAAFDAGLTPGAPHNRVLVGLTYAAGRLFGRRS